FGKIGQQRESMTVNSSDTSVSRSTQLDMAVPASKIASLSAGEFVGMVADDPEQRIPLKVFHSEILNDHEAIRAEESGYNDIPEVREVSQEAILDNYFQIKEDVKLIIEMTLGTPA